MTEQSRQSQVIEEIQLTDNLKLSVSVAFDETVVYLDVDFMNGKFTIQRNFTNNYDGLELLENTKKEFNTEDAVKSYLGL